MLVSIDEIFLNVIDDGRRVDNPFIQHIWSDYNESDDFETRRSKVYEINDILISIIEYFKRVVYKKPLANYYELPANPNFKTLYMNRALDKTLVNAVRSWFGFFNNITYDMAKKIEDIYYPKCVTHLTQTYNREVGLFIRTTTLSSDEAETELSKMYLYFQQLLTQLECKIETRRYTKNDLKNT